MTEQVSPQARFEEIAEYYESRDLHNDRVSDLISYGVEEHAAREAAEKERAAWMDEARTARANAAEAQATINEAMAYINESARLGKSAWVSSIRKILDSPAGQETENR